MTAHWADELSDYAEDVFPVPELENFYLLASLQFGDPDSDDWYDEHFDAFSELWKKYQREAKCYLYSAYSVAMQFQFWYERNQPVDKPDKPSP